MHIRKNTDYALRTLMFLACLKPAERSNISHISEVFNISKNHLMKVVHSLSQLGYLDTVRGKGGGIRLGRAASDINLGELIRELEPVHQMIDCSDGPCRFRGQCRLASVLHEAANTFVDVLSHYTLADLVENDIELKKVIGLL